MSKIKILMGLIVVIIIIVSILLIFSDNIFKQKGTDFYSDTEFEKEINDNSIKKLQYVKNTNKYYEIKKILNEYVQNCNNYLTYDASDINDTVFTEDEKVQYIEEIKEEYYNKINAVIAEEYKKENKLENIIKQYNADSINIEDMYIEEKSVSINVYLVYGFMENANEQVSFMVVTDSKNSAYMIYPEEYIKRNSFDTLKIGDSIDYKIEQIEVNKYNKLQYRNITEETIIKDYFSDYKHIMLEDTNKAYELLEGDYKNNRFTNKEKFEQFIDKNKAELESAYVKKYLINNYDDVKEYVCKDQYENLYIFESNAVMEYSVKLDTYTIPTEKFKTEYNKSDDQNKIMLNIDKWIKMLNNRDYSAAYKVLDETFKNNKFGSEEKFEQYMREKFPLHYKLEFGEYTNEADIGMQKIILTDITREDSTVIENTIIMKLKDNYDFAMSFEIK